MATRTTVTLHYLDSYGKPTTRSYTARADNPTDAVVQALAEDAQAIAALSLVDATVTRHVDVSGVTTAAETKSSRQKDASLIYFKSALRNSFAGRYTFNFPEIKAALLDASGNILTANAAFANWSENFDDGSGIGAVVGDFYVSETEELVEEQTVIEGYQNKD